MAEEIKGSVPSDIKVSNRQTILNIYRNKKVQTPNDVSAAVGLSRQTVSKAIEYFLGKGILVSAGKGNSTESGGRRPKYYELSRDICFAAVNAEDCVVHFSVFNLYSEILFKHEEPISFQPEYAEFEEAVKKGADVILSALPSDIKIYGISVTLRGLADSTELSLRFSPHYPKWGKNRSVKSLVRFFPDADLLVLDKPVRTFARCLLEKNLHEFTDKRVLVLFYRNGMAGALIDRGHIDHGTNSIIGEFSLMFTDEREGTVFGEALSAAQVIDFVRNNRKDLQSPLLTGGNISYTDIFQASRENDPAGRAACERLAHLFAVMLRNINLSFDADKIILVGEYAECDEHFLDIVRKEVSGFIYYPDDYEPDILCDKTPLDEMLVLGSMSNLLHAYYRDIRLYTGDMI